MTQPQQHLLTSLTKDGQSYFYDLPTKHKTREAGWGSATYLYTMPALLPDVSYHSTADLDATAKDAPTGLTTGRIVTENGLSSQIITLAPRTETPNHRTRTVDIIMVYEGEVDLHLDQGVRTLKQGDTVVIRGSRHYWVNKSVHVVKMFGIAVDAQKILDGDGMELKEGGLA